MPTVLIVDDDPSHLKIYSWIVERGGYRTVLLLAWGPRLVLPKSESVDLVLLDYRLGEDLTAADVARQLRAAFPNAPILVLSDLLYMPEDMQEHATAFVRKGHPDRLLETLASFLKPNPEKVPPVKPAA